MSSQRIRITCAMLIERQTTYRKVASCSQTDVCVYSVWAASFTILTAFTFAFQIWDANNFDTANQFLVNSYLVH